MSGDTAPEEALIWITDDRDARSFLVGCGLLAALEKVAATHGVIAAIKRDHPTHWVLGIKHVGNERAEDNGFIVCGWPKSKFNETVVAAQLERMKISPRNAQWSTTYRTGDPTGFQ